MESKRSDISPTLAFSKPSLRLDSQVLGSLETLEPEDLRVLKRIDDQHGTNLLVFSISKNKNFNMKVFKHINGEISPEYIRENRLAAIQHPNIMSIVSSAECQKVYHRKKNFNISYILTEIPRGDLSSLLSEADFSKNEKLVRAYFHDLISGLDYLHSLGIAHCNLNFDNLLIGENFELKIHEFQYAIVPGDDTFKVHGSKHFRAPEVLDSRCDDPRKADIYSAGIILFGLRTGFLPYFEDQLIREHDLYKLLITDPNKFWKIHESINPIVKELSHEFKSLFLMMVNPDIEKRATIEEIKNSAWFLEAKASENEVMREISGYY